MNKIKIVKIAILSLIKKITINKIKLKKKNTNNKIFKIKMKK